MQSLRKIVQRALAVGAKIWCLPVFLCHAPRPACCLFNGVYFEQILCRGLWVDFDAVYILFSEEVVLSDVLQSAFFVARLRNNFREIAVTNCEKSNLSYRGKPVLRTVASLGACGRLAVLN